jgi:hypothetical protein
MEQEHLLKRGATPSTKSNPIFVRMSCEGATRHPHILETGEAVSFGENRRRPSRSAAPVRTRNAAPVTVQASEAARERGRVVCTQLSMQGIEGNINGLPAVGLSLPPYPG